MMVIFNIYGTYPRYVPLRVIYPPNLSRVRIKKGVKIKLFIYLYREEPEDPEFL